MAVAAAAPVTITPECSRSSTTVSCPPVDGGGEAMAMVGVEASSANTTTQQQQQQHNVTASVPRMEDLGILLVVGLAYEFTRRHCAAAAV